MNIPFIENLSILSQNLFFFLDDKFSFDQNKCFTAPCLLPTHSSGLSRTVSLRSVTAKEEQEVTEG